MTSRETEDKKCSATPQKVKFWDSQYQDIFEIPEDELSSSMIISFDKLTGELVWLEDMNIEKNNERFADPFDQSTKQSIAIIAESLYQVESKSPKDWELEFRKEIHPFEEINIWLKISASFKHALENFPCTLGNLEDIYQSFLLCSRYHDKLKIELKKHLADEDILKFINTYYQK